MKHYEELKAAVAKHDLAAEYALRIKSMGFVGRHGEREAIGITQSDNMRYTIGGIAKVIGEEKLKALIEQFEALLSHELHKHLLHAKGELDKYHITHQDCLVERFQERI